MGTVILRIHQRRHIEELLLSERCCFKYIFFFFSQRENQFMGHSSIIGFFHVPVVYYAIKMFVAGLVFASYTLTSLKIIWASTVSRYNLYILAGVTSKLPCTPEFCACRLIQRQNRSAPFRTVLTTVAVQSGRTSAQY